MQVILIRHAHSQANAKGVLAGRLPKNNLSEKGEQQAQELTKRLGNFPVKQIRISPMPRCRQTVTPWLQQLGKSATTKVLVDQDLNEVDYGSWSGKKLAVLSRNKLWKTVQNSPSAMYFPAGEGLAHMQQRAMQAVHRGLEVKGKGALVIVSHGDVIKSIVASSLGMHLDDFQRIVIDPASVSILEFSGGVPRVVLLNDTRSNLGEMLRGPAHKANLLGGGTGK